MITHRALRAAQNRELFALLGKPYRDQKHATSSALLVSRLRKQETRPCCSTADPATAISSALRLVLSCALFAMRDAACNLIVYHLRALEQQKLRLARLLSRGAVWVELPPPHPSGGQTETVTHVGICRPAQGGSILAFCTPGSAPLALNIRPRAQASCGNQLNGQQRQFVPTLAAG